LKTAEERSAFLRQDPGEVGDTSCYFGRQAFVEVSRSQVFDDAPLLCDRLAEVAEHQNSLGQRSKVVIREVTTLTPFSAGPAATAAASGPAAGGGGRCS